ncbi:hypothetical protein PILCRDRAFT_750877 [Piloderma croceum F 1598]|uniref:Uncharacterized protein n=1 Tax=Piloderma croceum (strain F 1598) TaxID=765440 RepID=A0A0C3EV41_PILCF|nr:hypothetical protein PILCRDRAFT_750877 [Piloderma croceum F 1598]
MESLWYLASNISKIDGSARLMEPLVEELQKLADDLETASRQNKIEVFFYGGDELSSLENHNEALNNIITDLTVSDGNRIIFHSGHDYH